MEEQLYFNDMLPFPLQGYLLRTGLIQELMPVKEEQNFNDMLPFPLQGYLLRTDFSQELMPVKEVQNFNDMLPFPLQGYLLRTGFRNLCQWKRRRISTTCCLSLYKYAFLL